MSIIDDPLSCITSAIETMVGWSCVYMFTWLLGIYIGTCIGTGQLENILWVPAVPLILLVSVFKNPYFVLSFVGFFGFWALPLYLDSSRVRIVLLILALGAAIYSGYGLTTVHFM